ncbi:hypothetical protein CAter282_0253 [Collimonas arenae]|uniref:Uncharacterized protein n=1 Tax=Collimonas arenae TaxID=279058 RepID=A0A127QE10_9BURK|nr:hypothetical protein CAter10_0268 [Collimonas arenae]AMP08075.1 hypothetical protein CAter282_0253 [Collimonas arenae]
MTPWILPFQTAKRGTLAESFHHAAGRFLALGNCILEPANSLSPHLVACCSGMDQL